MELETFLKPVKKTLIALGLVSLLGATAFTVNYFNTHKDKVKAEETSERIEYSHPDEETTHILNYIAGKEEVSAEENEKFYCDTDFSHGTGIKDEFNPSLYATLWEMEMELGSPRIKWIDWSKKCSLAGLSGNNQYNPFSHTVYLECGTPKEVIENLMEEFSHALQFEDNQLRAYHLFVESGIRSLANMAIHDEKLWPAYCREYSTWGSFEFEAHREIGPELKKRLKTAINEKTGK